MALECAEALISWKTGSRSILPLKPMRIVRNKNSMVPMREKDVILKLDYVFCEFVSWGGCGLGFSEIQLSAIWHIKSSIVKRVINNYYFNFLLYKYTASMKNYFVTILYATTHFISRSIHITILSSNPLYHLKPIPPKTI